MQQTVRTPRLWVRRTVFLLAGGAVAAALAILTAALIAPVQEDVLVTAFVALLTVLLLGVGLLPGVREVQVAGAEALLGVRPQSVTAPAQMRWTHRWRTALWTVIHLMAGALTGVLLLAAGLPLAGLLVWVTGGGPIVIADQSLRAPTSFGDWALALLANAAIVGVALAVIAGLGRAAAASAPSLLGPVGEDRLRMAEQRLEREQASVRLSRDLHDGVGHSLSAISLQAGAGRRAIAGGGEPEAVLQTLRTIEELSGQAVQELDHALAVLRGDSAQRPDSASPRRPAGRVGQLDLQALADLVGGHRARGMVLEAELPSPARTEGLPPVISRAAYRFVAEALSNAAKHGAGAGPVAVAVQPGLGHLTIEVRNPVPFGPDSAEETRRSGTHSHGLDALREQVDLLDGRMSVGPETPSTVEGMGTGQWRLWVELPTGGGGRRG